MASATNSTTTTVTLEWLEGASPLSRGIYAISARTLCAMHVFRFSRILFCSSPSPFKCYTSFTVEFCFCYHILNDSNTIPNHGRATTLLYVNGELTYTPRITYSAVRTLRSGGGPRNALLRRRFRSAISRKTLRVEPDVASGIKCKYDRARTSRLYLASDPRTTPPSESLVIASDLEFYRPGVCVCSSLQNSFVLHI